MKLTQDVIFYHLNKVFSCEFKVKLENSNGFDRPVFYGDDIIPSNRAVIIDKADLSDITESSILSQNILLICPYVIQYTDALPPCSMIAFKENISPRRVLNLFNRIYERFDRWDDELKRIYYEGDNFQELVDCCSSVIFDPVCIVDKQFSYVAYCKLSHERGLDAYVDDDNNIVVDLVNEFISNLQFPEYYKKTSAFTYTYSAGGGISKNIFNRGNYVGRVLIESNIGNEALMLYYSSILDHFTYYAEKLYNKHLSFSNRKIYISNMRTLILDSLNNKNIMSEQWEQATQEIGWSKGDKLQMIQLRPNPRYDKNLYADYLSIEIEKIWHGCVIFDYNNHLLFLVNRDKFSSREGLNFNQTLAYFLRDNLLVAGMSRPFSNTAYLKPAYIHTEVALDYGVRESPSLWYFKFDDYALKYMVSNSQGGLELEMICSEMLLKLRLHDLEKKTEYYNTLLTYFNCRFNAVAASKQLYIQRSTFLYRMDKIQDLINIDFSDESELLYLSLSFRLLEEI